MILTTHAPESGILHFLSSLTFFSWPSCRQTPGGGHPDGAEPGGELRTPRSSADEAHHPHHAPLLRQRRGGLAAAAEEPAAPRRLGGEITELPSLCPRCSSTSSLTLTFTTSTLPVELINSKPIKVLLTCRQQNLLKYLPTRRFSRDSRSLFGCHATYHPSPGEEVGEQLEEEEEKKKKSRQHADSTWAAKRS